LGLGTDARCTTDPVNVGGHRTNFRFMSCYLREFLQKPVEERVGYRYGYPLVWHAEVCVHDSPQVARGGCLVEPGAGRVLGPAVNGVKAAAQAGPGEVAGHERQPTSAGVAGDDVVGVIDMRGVAR